MKFPPHPIAALIIAISPVAHASKRKSVLQQAVEAYQSTSSYTLPAAGTVELAFSPNEGSEHLVIKVIDSAQRELRVLAYSFTSVPVTEALVRARHRGVQVFVEAARPGQPSVPCRRPVPTSARSAPTPSTTTRS
jgi:phosphatidylserine/phosphatidylglycerophosphate/cardiolipin synthase-like enzyme